MKSKSVLCVDPGGYTMGAALFNYQAFKDQSTVANPLWCFTHSFTPHQRDVFTSNQALLGYMNILSKKFDTETIVQCYCEKPKSYNFAASVKGHIQMLDTFRGALIQMCHDHKCEYHDIEVMKWKGNLPKKLVIDRIKEILGNHVMLMSQNGHDWDAVGIGLYVQGVF